MMVNKEQNCRSHNVGYRISCDSCNMTYEGESHRMISVRASEHVRDLRKGAKNSPLYKQKHKVSQHPNRGCSFKIEVTGSFLNALSRQADESARIQTNYGRSDKVKWEQCSYMVIWEHLQNITVPI